jgi:hypothetical protein
VSAGGDPLHDQVAEGHGEIFHRHAQRGRVAPRHALVVGGLGVRRTTSGAAVDVVAKQLVLADRSVGQVDHRQPHLWQVKSAAEAAALVGDCRLGAVGRGLQASHH